MDRGVDINKRNKAGATAITIAAENGHTNIVDFLIKHGADIESADNGGWTALLIATSKGQQWAAFLLIEKGANVNIQNKRGSTPLTFAAENGLSEIARKLIQAEADVNHQLPNGKAPLDLARKNSHDDIVAMLKEKGAKTVTVRASHRLLQWKRRENPMGFTMPYPDGWERISDDPLIIVPPDYNILLEGSIVSPSITLMVGGMPS